MFELTVSGYFSGAHRLRGYKGKCEKLHGHNWKVEVVVSGEIDESGMVIDFTILKQCLEKVLSTLDHKYLNNIPYFKKRNPSSENTALYIFLRIKKLLINYNVQVKKVVVWENEKQCASYYLVD
ncbi:MAG: 6-carboxy-5,6,7,8-tetrahydropterin synthase [candidate division TA06 bacterium ADurb.Bin131]|uniref:6-carboxy-5,6,7,8-tetrahydropterin synthase n=1 Tax=candidate division TA06 bacterium ADurb.Bin131 TaxID=1852827 RepID=A0A1V6CB96_UNCT6|nr:MAG: 6-carboxy-5,6,7,8-tetrahydropterin synthase [candidate division TA06 bacterium ADurb.Bin131]